jgi:hypothetical protein
VKQQAVVGRKFFYPFQKLIIQEDAGRATPVRGCFRE